MSQPLRFNSTDPRVAFEGQWTSNWRQNGTSMSATQSGFFFIFRGTSIKVYGGSVGEATWTMQIDGEYYTVQTQGNLADIRSTPIFSSGGLDDGDHQFWGRDTSLPVNGLAYVDYFEIENSSGRGYDLLSSGPTSPDVPAQAVTVDNTSPDIILGNASQWELTGDVGCYQKTRTWSRVHGASLSYSFSGVAIWYYARNGPDLAVFNVSIDGSTPQRVDATSKLGMNQRLLWSNTSLGAGRHTLTLTNDGVNDSNNTWFALDFFRVLRAEDASALDSITSTTIVGAVPTDAQTVDSSNEAQRVPLPIVLSVSLTLGLLAVVAILAAGYFYVYRRRRRASMDRESPSIPAPYAIPPMTRAQQQSGPISLQVGKHRPQSTGPSGAQMFMDIRSLTMGTESGPPPSYETLGESSATE